MSCRVRPSSIGIDALDRPHGGYISKARILGRLEAVHEPDRHIAAGVAPQNVGPAVAVEIAGLGDRPDVRYVSETRRLVEVGAVHDPDLHIAADIAPQNVAL